ncbi:MAG: hypothetical protein AAF709_10815 [Pseudomonadota bacterium]
MTALGLRLIIALCGLVAAGAPTLASEPTAHPEPAAETRPAVDGVNSKLSLGGTLSDPNVWGGTGALTIPLGEQFGLQLDGALASNTGDSDLDVQVYGAGGHLFWRDPSVALVGIYGHFLRINVAEELNLFALGLETERYLGRFSIGVLVGVVGGDGEIDTDMIAHGKLAYYPTDNLQLSISPKYGYGNSSLGAEAEYGFGEISTMAAIFGTASVSETGDQFFEAGVRVYFGSQNKSLIERHRQDDPSLVSPLGSTGRIIDVTTFECFTNIHRHPSLSLSGTEHPRAPTRICTQ